MGSSATRRTYPPSPAGTPAAAAKHGAEQATDSRTDTWEDGPCGSTSSSTRSGAGDTSAEVADSLSRSANDGVERSGGEPAEEVGTAFLFKALLFLQIRVRIPDALLVRCLPIGPQEAFVGRLSEHGHAVRETVGTDFQLVPVCPEPRGFVDVAQALLPGSLMLFESGVDEQVRREMRHLLQARDVLLADGLQDLGLSFRGQLVDSLQFLSDALVVLHHVRGFAGVHGRFVLQNDFLTTARDPFPDVIALGVLADVNHGAFAGTPRAAVPSATATGDSTIQSRKLTEVSGEVRGLERRYAASSTGDVVRHISTPGGWRR